MAAGGVPDHSTIFGGVRPKRRRGKLLSVKTTRRDMGGLKDFGPAAGWEEVVAGTANLKNPPFAREGWVTTDKEVPKTRGLAWRKSGGLQFRNLGGEISPEAVRKEKDP